MSFLNLSPSPEPSDIMSDTICATKSEQPESKLNNTTRENNVMSGSKVSSNVPTHPIPSMQGAFAESFLESSSGSTNFSNQRLNSAAERRQILLEQNANDETHAARWKLRPGQKFHEFWKLIAQISFGVYLLLNGIARDESQVMKILQVHVDEVDDFLETTLEDFNMAQDDIEERLKYLKLPLKNINIFDTMLEDRNFRRNIVEGNEKIEHVIARTAMAMNEALKDVQQGANSCQEFTDYLAREQDNLSWKDQMNMCRVYEAMKGNLDGWCKAFDSLKTKGIHLDVALVQLGSIVAELDRRAGEVSRKTRFSSTPPSISSKPAANNVLNQESRAPQRIRQSLCKGVKPTASLVSPAVVPSSFESIPELDTDLFSGDLPDLILKPHTYTPVSSPSLKKSKPATKIEPITPTSPSTAELGRNSSLGRSSSLRHRFSLSRRGSPRVSGDKVDGNSPSRSAKTRSPIKGTTHQDPRTCHILTPPSQGSEFSNMLHLDKESSIHSTTQKQDQSSMSGQTHPHHGDNITQTNVTLPSTSLGSYPYTTAYDSTQCQKHSEPSPLLTPMTIKIPDQQYFRPVNASPHSPLQRPWTASPSQNPLHAHPNSSSSSSSNLSNYSSHSRHNGNNNNRYNSQTPNTMRNLPSAMGMSVRSEMTAKGLRKKRSMFGWLKEQFSLSEEEREAFENKKRRGGMQRMKIDMIQQESIYE